MKKSLKKLGTVLLISTMAMTSFTGCGSKESNQDEKITVVSREDGSGTRGAFVELTGIEKDDVDNTTTEAVITNKTQVMMTTVAGDSNSIGYISLGSLNDTIKAVKVNGVEATSDNIKNGKYEISRPFNIATKDDVSSLAKDFINYILSDEGQKVITDNGYVEIDDKTTYTTSNESGKIVVAGSSSVTPVMEKLKEAYLKVNTGAQIEIQESDSTTGIESLAAGTCDIAMASRDLKDSEIAKGLKPTVIAMDGIAVIVNNDSKIDDLSTEQIQKIFTGECASWSDVK